MDPLSIAASAAGIAGACFKVTTAIYSFAGDAHNVDWTVGDLLQEIQGISRVSEAINSTWTKNSLLVAAQANSDGDLWNCVKESLDDTKRTLVKLDDKLEELKPQSFLARGFLRRPVKALKLNLSLKEINTFKQQLQSHQSGMQSSLLMINVCLLLGSNSSSDSINQVLGGLRDQIRRVEVALQGQHQVEDPEEAEDNARIAYRLRSLVRAAESIHSSASTVVGGSRSTVWGGSVMGDPLNEEDYGYIQQWIPPPAIAEEDELSNHSGSKLDSDLTGSTFNGSDQDSDDSDIERHLNKRYRELAFKALEQKDYSRAESFYRKVIDRNGQDDIPLAEIRKMKIMLAYVCSLQEKWDEAEEILVPIAMAKGTPEIMAYHGLHGLSLVRLEKGDLDLAIKYCKRAAGGHKKFGGKTSTSYYRSMMLLANIYSLKGDPTAAEGYRSFLPQTFVGEFEEDARSYMENIVIETVSGLRGTPSLSNIASIDVRSLTPTPGGRRNSDFAHQNQTEIDLLSPSLGSTGQISSSTLDVNSTLTLDVPSRPSAPVYAATHQSNMQDLYRTVPIRPGVPQEIQFHEAGLYENPLSGLVSTPLAEGQYGPQGPDPAREVLHPETSSLFLSPYYYELDANETSYENPISSRKTTLFLSDLLDSDAKYLFKPLESDVFRSIPRPGFLDSGNKPENPSSVKSYLKNYVTEETAKPWFEQRDSWRIVIAIDLTSNEAAVAFAAGAANALKPIILIDQTSNKTKWVMTPTISYHNLLGDMLGWGNDKPYAESFLEQARALELVKSYPICNFKIDIAKIFYSLLTEYDTNRLSKARRNIFRGKSRIDFLAEYLAKFRILIHDHLETILGEPFTRKVEYHAVEYVFTVPNGTTQSGQHALIEAAEKAGFIKGGKKKRISTIPITEAALLESVYSGLVDLDIGDVILNINVADEKVTVQSFEVKHTKGTLSSCTPLLQGLFGTSMVREHFDTMLDRKVSVIKDSDSRSNLVTKFLEKSKDYFESRIQHSFTNNGQKWVTDIGFEVECPEAGVEEGYIIFSNDEILSCFEPLLQALRQLTRLQLQALERKNRQLNYVLLSGFNKIHYITQTLRQMLPMTHWDIIICLPDNTTPFIRGGVIAGLIKNSNEDLTEIEDDNPGVIKYTYLIANPLEFDSSKHLESIRVTNIDGIDRCYDSVQVFLRSGSIVTLGEVMNMTIKRPVILGDLLVFQDNIYSYNMRIETGAVFSMSSHFGRTAPPVTKVATLTTNLANQHPENYFQKYPRKRGGWYYTVEYQIFFRIRMSNDTIPVPELYVQSAFMGDELTVVGELTLPLETFRNVLFSKT